MKHLSKFAALAMTAALTVSLFAGCSGNKTTTTGTTAAKEYDFYIFNTKGENAKALQAAVDAYSKETNQKVKVFSLGAGTASGDALRTEMNSKTKPAVFSIMNIQELKEWTEGGFALDLNKATQKDFVALHNAVPQNLRLTNDGTKSYGIPYNVEGYGYIIDKRMAADLVGKDKADGFVADLKASSYAEFEGLVKALAAYIKSNTAATVTVNGKAYPLAAAKGDFSKKLTGVFATAGAEKWTYGDHFLNIAVDAAFANPSAAAAATAAQIDSMKGPLLAYAKALDLKTGNAAGANGPLSRGADFITKTTANYDASVQIFSDSKAVFLKQGNWVYTNIEKVNKDIVASLTFIPVKMPFTSADIKASGLTVEKMAKSIPVFVPNYYAINAKAPADEQEKGQQFLAWLNGTPAGQKFIIEDMAFIPYNADPAKTKIPNSLGQSIVEYINAGNTITNAYAGTPTGWPGEIVGLKIMESYLTKAAWTDADYNAIADYAIAQWKDKAGVK